ncbi:MAG: Ig-like domain-containing protein, partial [Anaerovoracaceae bacterium]
MQSKKMSRAARIICLTFVCLMALTALSFAATSTQDLKLTKTYPENNATGRSKDNMCVKLYFNKPVSSAAAKKANKDAFSFKDEKGHTLPSRILYSKKNKKYVLVIVDTNKLAAQKKTDLLQDDTKYTCTIKADFRDDSGNTLGSDHVITFRTMNQKRNNMVYMIMMFAMMGGMVVFSVIQVRRDSEKKQKEIIEKGGSFNPYKEAKATGKSVQEVVAKHEAELKKGEAKREKKKEEERIEELESD